MFTGLTAMCSAFALIMGMGVGVSGLPFVSASCALFS